MRLVSYNILASQYIRPEWYRDVPVEFLEWESRKKLLLPHILSLNGDILCLQEVENPVFDELMAELKPQGYQGIFARKGFGRQDGCATFYRGRKFRFAGGRAIYFNDQGKNKKPSGHVALLLKFKWEGHIIGVVNTHIRWNRPDKPLEEHQGYCEVREMLAQFTDEEVEEWLLCGDFNADDDTEVIQLVRDAGFRDVYDDMKLFTHSKEGLARIDYIFYSKGLEAHPDPIEKLNEGALLPSLTQPSDHLAISALIELRRASASALEGH